MPVDTALKSFMEKRRSTPVLHLGEPGPGRAELEEILRIGARVPDHGKLAPWRFVIFSGAARARLGEQLAAIAAEKTPGMSDKLHEIERTRLTRAPVVVMLVSRAAPHPKIPEWEQELSAGAVGMNLLIGTKALGYSAAWITEWPAYDAAAASLLGVEPHERIAGFIHIGTPKEPPFERARPELDDLVTWVEE